MVDAKNPWVEGLEPKVVLDENGELVLGWFEKDTSLSESVKAIGEKVDALNGSVEVHGAEINSLKSKIKVN